MFTRIKKAFGFDRVSDGFLKFFYTHTGFLVFTNLHDVFINTLFFRYTGDSNIVMRFNIYMYIFWGIIFAASVVLAKKRSPVACMRLGIISYILMYITFFLCINFLDKCVPLLALLAGAGGGCYWLSNSITLGEYADEESRDAGMGLIGVGGGIVSLCMPFFSGLIISCFEGLTGYLVVFGLALVVAVMTILVSMTLPPVQMQDTNVYYKEATHLCIFDPIFRDLMISSSIKGIRDGTMGFFLSVLLYEVITSEFVVGVNTLLAGIAGILCSMVYGRLVNVKNRIKWMYWSTHALMLGALLLLKLSPVTIILMSIINAVFRFYLMNPCAGVYYSMLDKPELNKMAYEFHGIKEIVLTFGRVGGIWFAMIMPSSMAVAVILVLTATQYAMTWLMERSWKGYVARYGEPQ